MKKIGQAALLTLFLVSFSACSVSDPEQPGFILQAPPGFGPIPYPEDNEPTEDRVELGRMLFFDKRLSSDLTISCASCHDPNVAFADPRPVSIGVFGRQGERNAPSLINAAYLPHVLREGGVPTLEMQVLVPVQEHNEFDMNMLDVVERLSNDDTYRTFSNRAYDREIDPYVITRAIASFERSLLSTGSRYDRAISSEGGEVLTEQEQRGMELFMSQRTECSTCHVPPQFTTHEFANNGLYREYSDEGRARLTNDPADDGVFKIPSLRNIALTAPYMHDGSEETLEGVVSHYNSGGFYHKNKSSLVKPLGLTEAEELAIVAFLRTLTDEH